MGGVTTQLFPPKPSFTEANCPSLSGKVFIVTGGNAGVGLELVKILYLKGGTVYIASRSLSKIATEIEAIKAIPTATPGQLKSLALDLNDFSTIAPCVADFLAQESRLDVLWNNAGISHPPPGAGVEAIMRVNCLGTYLFTKMLLPILTKTAQASARGSVRVVFVSSGIIEMTGPPGGLSLAELTPGNYSKDPSRNYSASKAGSWFLASELHKEVCGSGVVCVAVSPGTLKTKGWDNAPWAMKKIMSLVMHEPKMGAYSELWAGLSDEVKLEGGGRFAIAWGRWHPGPPEKLLKSLRSMEEGGTGLAEEFRRWCEEQTKGYLV